MRSRGWIVVWLLAAVAVAASGCGIANPPPSSEIQTALAEDQAFDLISSTPGPIASLTPRATWTFTPSPARKTAIAKATLRAAGPTRTPKPTKTPKNTDTPKPTKTPKPTHVPQPTRTPKPTHTPRPTKTPEPTETPKPDRLHVDLVRVDPELQAVVVTNETTDAKRTIFELAGKANRNPIHSAAWSPDGKSVIIAYTWARSVYEQGIVVHRVQADGSQGRDVLALSTAGQDRALGNALWSPDGKRIVLWLADGPNNGVYIMNADGSGLKRLDNSIPGEWPRYWTADGTWIVTIADDGRLYALEANGARRVPLSSLGAPALVDQRKTPWKMTDQPACTSTVKSWWRCR